VQPPPPMFDGATAAESADSDGDDAGDVVLLDVGVPGTGAWPVSAIRVWAARESEAMITSPVAPPEAAGTNAT